MTETLAITGSPGGKEAADFTETLDLAVLAKVGRNDRVEIECLANRTLDLFNRTLKLVDEQHGSAIPVQTNEHNYARFVPEHGDLRQRFLFAETLGSYSALHDLLDKHSPAYKLSKDFENQSSASRLSDSQMQALENYRDEIHRALVHANEHLLANVSSNYTSEELHELNAILIEARNRFESVNAILGAQLIRDIEDAVKQLYVFQDKIRFVQRSIDGIFLVDSEIMFMPTNDLIDIVNKLFKGVGNPYVAEHIDGMVLLAARNLLIQSVSFYSYYGQQQIYTAIKKNRTAVNRSVITHHIRSEIKKLFRACSSENRLILKRVMNNAEREFEISIESITVAAERTAIEVMNRLLPEEATEPTRKTWWQRFRAWLFR